MTDDSFVWRLASESRATVEVHGGGLLPGSAHERAFSTAPALLDLRTAPPGTAEPGAARVEARLAAADLLPEGELSARDRALILRNLRGPKVLNAERHPWIHFVGDWQGDWQRGRLSGELSLAGRPAPIVFEVELAPGEAGCIHARAHWTGTLRALGLEPFSALMGAVKLKDWARIRLDLHFEPAA